MLRTVGDTAERVSRRKLALFPRMRGCSVLMDSRGRWETCARGGIIGSEVVMMGGGAGDGGIEGCDMESIARLDGVCREGQADDKRGAGSALGGYTARTRIPTECC